MIVGGTPANIAYFYAYETAKKGLAENSEAVRNNLFLGHFTAGMVAEAVR